MHPTCFFAGYTVKYYDYRFGEMTGMKIVLELLWFYRQGGKDLTKKGPNIKLGPQGDKKGLGQDPRKDGSMDSGHHVKVQILSMRNFHHSLQGYFTNVCAWNVLISFFCFYIIFVVSQLEELMSTLERTRQELDATKQRLSSTQQSLQERDSHLTNMRQERRKQLEEILEMKLVSSPHVTNI